MRASDARDRSPGRGRATWTAAAATSLVAVLLAANGCASSDEATAVGPSARCSSDVDCGDGTLCYVGQCLDRNTAAVRDIDVEITPPLSSDLARTQLVAIAFDPAVEATLEVGRPTLFRGLQVVDVPPHSISARVSFRGQGRIPTRELDTAVLLDAGRATDLSLLPSIYHVRLLPTDAERYPGVEILNFRVDAGGPVDGRILQVPSTYRVLRGDVSRRTTNQDKLAGIHVSARSTASGLPSTTVVTDRSGRFEILLPDTPDTTFVLTASLAVSPTAPPPPSWGFEQTVTVLDKALREISIPLDDTTDEVRGALRLRVLGVGAPGAAPEKVVGARVVLTAQTGLDYRALVVEGTTDASGTLVDARGEPAVGLLSGRYAVRVEPPVTGAWRTKEVDLELLLGQGLLLDQQIQLERKAEVSGSITSQQGQPVVGAQVRYAPLDGGPREGVTTTDDDGRYRVLVEPGEYVLSVTPVANSRVGEALPVGTARVSVIDDVVSFEAGLLTLPGGALVRGVVRAPDGTALARAQLEMFKRLGGLAVSVARLTTDADGRFAAILPAP